MSQQLYETVNRQEEYEMAKNVYQLISAVAAEMAQEGISKNRKNQQQGYSFRGIDDVYNALAPIISKHGLVILPRIVARTLIERQTKTGGALFYVTVEAEFDFVSSHDGTRHTVKTYGEAMDSADKATNKAMSAAYKYAAFQTFCIPTEGDNDADATTHHVSSAVDLTPFLKAIEESTGKEEFTAAYQAAIKACGSDQSAQARVIAAKKARIDRAKQEKAE